MVIIIGGGLSGLLIGNRLKKAGISFKILEARDRLGGRIHTVMSADDTPVEMGATWFNDQHKNLKRLLEELGLSYFEQFMEGTSFFQPFSNQPASAIPIPPQSASYRVAGGTASIIRVLAENLENEDVVLGESIQKIDFTEPPAMVIGKDTYKASHVVLALPPKLWANTIDFNPTIPEQLMDIALNTHTWMEDSIKVALTFKRPFWKERKLSGTLFSNTGPITEFYDHSTKEEDKYALCGFVSPSFSSLTFADRKQRILDQLVYVFGNEVMEFIDFNEVAWSEENKTFTQNISSLYPHQNNGNPVYRSAYFEDRLLISSSEASPTFSGYMEGAVIAAEWVVDQLKASLVREGAL
ncbi:MAG: FAD-dependent oxidoreductase [Bacteroidota bacterium]